MSKKTFKKILPLTSIIPFLLYTYYTESIPITPGKFLCICFGLKTKHNNNNMIKCFGVSTKHYSRYEVYSYFYQLIKFFIIQE